ncbi:MAG: ROK family protein [Patescibacteria group bacterium]
MIVAVDTGGTKTLVAVFNTEGQIVSEQKFPTPTDVTDYVTQLKSTIDELLNDQPPTCLSVALPGTIVDGRMVWAGNLGWHDTDMKTLLSDHYECPIIVENDANLAGLAETRILETVPPLSLYMTVSTGIGTGVIVNGQIDPILSRVEGGRIMLKHDGEYVIWEHFASGKALFAKHAKLASEIQDPALWREIAENLAQGMLAILPFLRPDVVIIGGGVGTHLEKFADELNALLTDNLHDGYLPTIVSAAHPEEAVLYGCYYHALDSAAA